MSQSIIQLKQQHKTKVLKKAQTACLIKDKPEVVKLVEERCMLQYGLNDVIMLVLIDTGAQLSIIEKIVLEGSFTDIKIKSVADKLNDGDNLRVQWVN